MTHPRARIPLVFLSLLLAACSSSSALFEPERADDMADAGSVHLAVLAVAPWSDYASALQPDFSLDSDSAVQEVARDSRWQSQKNFSNMQAGAQSTLLNQPSDPVGLVPAVPAGPLYPLPDGTVQFPPPSASSPAAGSDSESPHIGPDSMLKYTAATALYQEVQLLNRHIRDAAIPAGFRPYMVRLQLSLMPSRRHAPYDAYTTLSFFIPGERGNTLDLGVSAPVLVRSTSDGIFQQPFGNGPKVLPLVVTDNLEASVQSRSIDRVRGLTASMLEFEKYSLAGGQVSSFIGEVVKPMYSAMLAKAMRDEVFGRDLNSLLTVARLSENTLRIRLGAMQEATANYAMVPRNHNITLLLMLPEGAPSLVEVVAKTVLVDTENGETLYSPGEQRKAERLALFQRTWKLSPLRLDTLATLHALAQQNDQKSFSSLLRASLPPEHPALAIERSIWIELVGMRMGDAYTSNLFEVPGQGQNLQESAEIFGSQTVVAEDNNNFTYVTLRESRLPESEQILAVLRSPSGTGHAAGLKPAEEVAGAESVSETGEGAGTEKDEGAEAPIPLVAGPKLVLPAESVKADLSRRELRLRFPSLMRWGLASEGEALELELTWAGRKQSFPARLKEVVSEDTHAGVPTQRRSLEPTDHFERKNKEKSL